MKEYQKELVAAWKDFVAGTIDAKTLKLKSAGFGIYQQKDGLTMMRIRRPGGIVTIDDLRNIAKFIDKYGAGYAHISTRQDIQIHGVKAEDVPAALEDCESMGFPFRGGGGDTFRNTLVSTASGLKKESVFDVIPYARALSAAFKTFDKAYALPRKIKIGFADCETDRFLAAVQDLGFIAKIADGKKVFETWIGGGIGFKARVGIKLFDSLPAEDAAKVAFALTRFFDEKGCRTNRSHARIRFLREDMGDAAFCEEVICRYKAEAEAPALSDSMLQSERYGVTSLSADMCGACDTAFATWKKLACTKLADDTFAVRIFVPFGNFTADRLIEFCNFLEPAGINDFQLLPTQDLLVRKVPENQLVALYRLLSEALADVDYTMKSFVGHIVTCIGCTVCKSGVCDSPSIGAALAKELDKALLPLDTDEKIAKAKLLIDELRISGCPNSCTAQSVVKYGFTCRKSNGADALVPFSPAERDKPAIGEPQAAIIPSSELAGYVLEKINENSLNNQPF